MTRIGYDHDPARANLDLRDPRLKRVMLRDPERCATLNEYAAATGMETGEVAEALGAYLDSHEMELELAGDEVFIHTGPNGREPGSATINVPPNLWEVLRARSDIPTSYALWRVTRALEAAGWAVEHNLARVTFGLAPVRIPPYLGIVAGHVVLPVLLSPSVEVLSSPIGLLEQYEHAGATAVAVVCAERQLDEIVTAVRRWILKRAMPVSMSILVLESPLYNPVLLSPADGAVNPVAISRDTLGRYFW